MATEVLGVSGRRILEAMVAGMEDLKALAGLAEGRLRSKQADLEQALVGWVGAHQRLLLREMLGHVDELDARIERLSREIEERMRPFAEELERLDTIPGIGRRGAEEVIAEIGVDMDCFPSAAHLAS